MGNSFKTLAQIHVTSPRVVKLSTQPTFENICLDLFLICEIGIAQNHGAIVLFNPYFESIYFIFL